MVLRTRMRSLIYDTSLEWTKLPSTVFAESNNPIGSIFVLPLAMVGFPAQYDKVQPFLLIVLFKKKFQKLYLGSGNKKASINIRNTSKIICSFVNLEHSLYGYTEKHNNINCT